MAYAFGGQSVQGQALDITVVGCYNLKDKEWFTKQDPYVVLEYSGQKFRTRTDTDGGKNPSFNETFKLALIEGLREINATVWNSNTIERDDYIGSTKILLSKVIETGYDDTQWSLTNSRNGKSSGTLKLILHYAGARTKEAKTEGSPMYLQAAPPAPVYYGQPPPAFGAAAPAYGPAGYPPQQLAAYPPPGGYCPPALPYGYQAALPTVYPPPVAYVAPPPPVRPTYYHSVSAPPAYGASAPPYPSTYPPTGYPPAGYPQYRH